MDQRIYDLLRWNCVSTKVNVMKYMMALVVLLSLSGCNSTAEIDEQSLASTENDGVVCKLEKRVGSNMMTRVCRSAEERAAQAEAGREGMLRLQRNGVTSNASGQ